MIRLLKNYYTRATLWPRLLVLAFFSVIGFNLLTSTSAATFSYVGEAENALLGGNVSKAPNALASAESALKFGGNGGAGTSGNQYLTPYAMGFAPYAYVPWGQVSMNTFGNDTGTKNFFVAFIQGSGCTPYWDGEPSLGLTSSRANTILTDINNVRAKGGDVSLSFGGQAGTELAIACSTIAATQAAYQKVIDKYALKSINFDLEGTSETNAAAMSRRVAASYNLQKANPGLRVTLTVPVEPNGLVASGGLNTVKQFYNAGVVVSSVGIMTMDYGNLSGAQSTRVISSITNTINQLKNVYAGATTAEIAKAINVIVMIGKNDTTEVFQLSDATAVKNYVAANGIGTLSYWSAARDQPCSGSNTAAADACSQISQTKYQFANIFKTAYP